MAKLVSVACNLPSGLIVSHGRAVMEDGKHKIDPITNRAVVEDTKEVRLFGPLFKSNPDTDPEAFGGIVAGFAITKGVDADWFADWVATHKNYFAPLTNGAIFALENTANVAAKAREMRGLKSGFDPLSEADAKAMSGGTLATAVKE